MLLYQAGPSTQDIVDTIPETAQTKLDEYFSPKKTMR